MALVDAPSGVAGGIGWQGGVDVIVTIDAHAVSAWDAGDLAAVVRI